MVENISVKWAFVMALTFILGIAISLYVGVSLVISITFSLAVAVVVLKCHHVPYKVTFKWLYESAYQAKNVYILVLMIGMNVSMWIASGIVPAIIYYGFDLIQDVNYLPFAFLISALLAFFLGTGLGTISTIGIALFSLGITLNIPVGMLMGALVSGAYVADRLSPISALVNFSLETIGVEFKEAFRETAKIMIPGMVIAFASYYLLGLQFHSALDISDILAYKSILNDHFFLSPLFFILPVMVLFISYKGVGSIKVLATGIGIGFLIGLFLQDMSLRNGIDYLLFGFSKTSDAPLIQSLYIGGMVPMLEVVVVIIGGISMIRVFEVCNWIQPIINLVEKKSVSRHQLIASTGILSTVLNALTCDQTVGILLPGKYLKSTYLEAKLKPQDLYESIANSGTAVAPMMPWNVNSIIIYAITGVSAFAYAPFAILNWVCFPLSIAYAYWRRVDKR